MTVPEIELIAYIYAIDRAIERLEKQSARLRVWMYRLTPERHTFMLAAQRGICAICKGSETRGRLQIDHDHSCCHTKPTCGQCTRGLLCGWCNKVLWRYKDDPKLLDAAGLEAAATYLRKYRLRRTIERISA